MKIVALAYNYKGYEKRPILFMKDGIIGDMQPIVIPKLHTWAEPELGFRMGADGQIQNYVLANDITTQMKDQDCHLAMSKCRDTYLPMMDIPTPVDSNNVTLRASINGSIAVKGHTASRVLSGWGAIGFIERFMKLYPGDIVLTGCPPHIKAPLKNGDVLVTEAWEKDALLGRLTNPIIGRRT